MMRMISIETMFENIKFKGIFYKPHLSAHRIYLDKKDIDHLEYVDCLDEDCYIMVYFKDQAYLKYHKGRQRLYLNEHWCIDGIEVQGWYGTWYTIDTQITDHTLYLLLEHEEYGDETEHLIIDHKGNFILDEVYNGFDDLNDFLEL